MADSRIKRIQNFFAITQDLAELLFEHGFHTPKEVYDATLSELIAIPRIGPATAAMLKGAH